MVRGGKIVEVIGGIRKGKYAQIPNDKQHKSMIELGKAYVEYYDDARCTKPTLEKGKQVIGITAGINLKHIGYRDPS